jgi:microcystin-dependent protein
MGTPYLAEIRITSFAFAPRGWALCDGALLSISTNQALFSLLGTLYGGNGQTNFALPDLRGRVPIHFGGGFAQGQAGGEQAHTLVLSELPSHTHTVSATTAAATVASPALARAAEAVTTNFAPPGTPAPLDPGAFASAGGSQAHENRSPFLVLNFVIALSGVFPQRSS